MTVLRELAVSLGYQIDAQQWRAAQQATEQLKRGMQGLEQAGRSAARGARGLPAALGSAGRSVMARAGGLFAPAPLQQPVRAVRARAANGRFLPAGSANQLFGGGGGGIGAVGAAASNALAPVNALGASVGTLQQNLMRLGLGVGFGAVVKGMIGLASDANETSNILEQVFGRDGMARVQEWASVTGKEIGRSQFTMRDYAGQLGAMLEPMTGSAEKAEKMSTDLSKLSVDLASFFNTADDDALLALKSGIAGEVEPLRRYGVVLLDATLQEFAHSKGITKKFQAMTVAEKTELRYQYIMAKTTKAQGDAARTADGFANSSRALKDAFKDLGTMAGQRLLPVANKLIVWGRDAIKMFGEVSSQSSIVEASVLTLAGAFVALNASTLGALIMPALLIAGIALAIDELMTMMKGGKTIIGDWLDSWGGIGTTAKAVKEIREEMQKLSAVMGTLVGTKSAYDKLYQLAPNSALGQWALQQSMELGKTSRPDTDKQGNPVHPHYGHPSPRVRATPEPVSPDRYTVLPYMDAIDAPRPLTARAGAAAGGGGGTTVVNMTNNNTVHVGTGTARDARNVGGAIDKANRKALDSVKRTVK